MIEAPAITHLEGTKLYSATDLIRVLRKEKGLFKFNLSAYLNTKKTLEFIESIHIDSLSEDLVLVVNKGRDAHTFVHCLVLVDLFTTLAPEVELRNEPFLSCLLMDELRVRCESESLMIGELHRITFNKKEFDNNVIKVKNAIKKRLGVSDWSRADSVQYIGKRTLEERISAYCRVLNNVDKVLEFVIKS